MNVSVTQENPIMIKCEISLPWEDVAPHYDKAMKNIRKNAQVPGFRKGKTPAALLRKRYEGHIIQEVSQALLTTTIENAIRENDIQAVGQPRVIDLQLKPKEDMVLVTEFDVMPEVELKDWQGIEAESLIINITDHQVDHELEHMLEHATTKETITDRPGQDGETVVISLTALDEEGESLTDLEKYEVKLGDESAHPELARLVSELKPEEDASSEFEAPDDDSFESWRGKKVKLFLEVQEIFKMNAPELDDAFAKANEAENMDELRQKVKDRLTNAAQDEEDQRMEGELITKLVEDYDFEVPAAVVEHEARRLIESQMMPYMQMMQGQDEQMRNSLVQSMMEYSIPTALMRVRSELILEALAEKEKIEVSEEELNSELEAFLAHSKADNIEDLKAELEAQGALEGLNTFIKRRSAVKLVRQAAKVTMVDKLTEVNDESAEAAHAHGHDHDHDHEHCGHDHGSTVVEAEVVEGTKSEENA